jgi:hypothetical protein
MAEVEGLSCAEIAEALAIPIGTVWTRLHAARRELRLALDGKGVDNQRRPPVPDFSRPRRYATADSREQRSRVSKPIAASARYVRAKSKRWKPSPMPCVSLSPPATNSTCGANARVCSLLSTQRWFPLSDAGQPSSC